ncbi:MAG: septum formation protein Maf [Candidatus Eremiobacteraeota bacterium]|nr:septum formation protein Maf [Candidatus Eremiobacteraeota bacterium]
MVLASGSPRRLALLRSLNFDVVVEKSAYHEPDDPTITPRELGIRHAAEKVRDVVARIGRNDVTVAADTVVDLDGSAYGKPRDSEDAKRMLRDLSGRTHRVHTAVAFTIPGDRSWNESLHEFCETSDVTFFALQGPEIDEYVASGEPMDKAGAYGIQGYGATLVERIDGDFYTVMGFPLARFVRRLRKLGFELPITNEKPAKT